MVATRTAIDAMTDAGLFEQLATAVLRVADADCAGLLHTGVNAAGMPVAAAVDGVGFGGGGGVVFVAHTITSRRDLATKWLHPEDGDLAKGIAAFHRLPGGSHARLILTSRVEPSIQLAGDVRARAHAQGFDVEIWSGSRLADFLDRDAEGQWIRRQFFGSDVTRLSTSLLREIAEAGPSAGQDFVDPALIVQRAVDEQVMSQLSGGNSLVLIAASGQGKSTTCASVWRRVTQAGGLALHVTETDVEAASTLPEALQAVLARACPTIAPDAAGDISRLAPPEGALVLIDDINRTARPLDALVKVLGWITSPRAAGLQILCPAWPQVVAALPEKSTKILAGRSFELPNLTPEEGRRIASVHAASQGVVCGALELSQIVSRFGADPLLLALHDYREGDTGTVAGFVDREVARTAAERHVAASDLSDALDLLAEQMLRRRDFAPTWRDLKGWLAADRQALGPLCATGTLIRRGAAADGERLMFRHDRVRDAILQRALVGLMSRGEAADVLSEPAFAELIGAVLARPEIPDDWVAAAAGANPLALFFGLADRARANEPLNPRLLAAVEGWLDCTPLDENNAHLSYACQSALLPVQAVEVRRLLPRLPPVSWWTREIGAMNGDLRAALILCRAFKPGREPLRHSHIMQSIRATYPDAALRYVSGLLADPATPAKDTIGALNLAWHLSDLRLAEPLRTFWRGQTPTADLVDAMLVATGRCAPELFPEIVKAWSELSEEKAEGGYSSPRGRVSYHGTARRALAEERDASVLPHLLAAAATDDAFARSVGAFVESWDDPDAQTFIVGCAARGENYRLSLSSISHWDERPGYGRRMSRATHERLMSIAMDEARDLSLRECALKLWRKAARRVDLPALHRIDPRGPLGDMAVQGRLAFADPSAASLLSEKLQTAKWRVMFWQECRGKWTQGLRPALDAELGRARELRSAEDADLEWVLPDVIRGMEDSEAEEVLSAHWDHLGHIPRYVHLALYIATPATRDLARRSVEAAAEKVEVFKYIEHHYGLYGEEPPIATEPRRLVSLLPYLDFLDQSAITDFWEHCNRMGWREWRRAHLDHRIEEHRSRELLDDPDRIESLEAELARGSEPTVHFWLRRILEQDGDFARLRGLLDGWVRARLDAQSLRIAIELVIEGGARVDVPMLQSWGELGIPGAQKRAQDALFALKRRTLSQDASFQAAVRV